MTVVPTLVQAEQKVLHGRKNLLSVTDATAASDSGWVEVPENVGRFILKFDATEDSAGGITVTVTTRDENGNDSDLTVHATASLTATGTTFVDDANVSGTGLLMSAVRVVTSSVTGQWDLDVDLIFAREK